MWPLRLREVLLNYADWIKYAPLAGFQKHPVFIWRTRWSARPSEDKVSYRNRLRVPWRTKGVEELCARSVEIPVPPPNQSSLQLTRLACIAPALWPAEGAAIMESAVTSMAGCNFCGFFVSSPSGQPPTHAGPCRVVNLASEPELQSAIASDPPSLRDNQGNMPKNSNLLPKVVHMLRRMNAEMLAGRITVDWICILETDLYFITSNFRRLVEMFAPLSTVFHSGVRPTFFGERLLICRQWQR